MLREIISSVIQNNGIDFSEIIVAFTLGFFALDLLLLGKNKLVNRRIKNAKDLFKGNLTIENLFMQLSSYKINVPIIEGKTLLFFDEVQTCPDVLSSLKAFAMDGRFDVIVSGSMLGIVMGNVSS